MRIETCGGGIILNIATRRYKLDNNIALNHFKAIDSSDDSTVLYEIINDSSSNFPNPVFLSNKMNLSLNEINAKLKTLKDENKIIVINSAKKNADDSVIISSKFYDGSKKYILDILSKFHKENPIAKGMKKEEIKSILFKRYSKVGDTTFEDLLNYMIETKVIKQINDLIANYDFDVVIDENISKDISNIERKYLDTAFSMPLTKDVVEEFAVVKGGKNNKLEIRQMIVDLARDGKLVKLSNNYYIHKKHYDTALDFVHKLFEKSDKITMPELRDMLNTSRKYAILIMEYFDQKRITKLVSDYRIKGERYC